MVRLSMTAAALLQIGAVLGLARDPGCGGGADSLSGGVNAPCTRTKDCGGDLVCEQGVCVDPDAPAPADGGVDADAGG